MDVKGVVDVAYFRQLSGTEASNGDGSSISADIMDRTGAPACRIMLNVGITHAVLMRRHSRSLIGSPDEEPGPSQSGCSNLPAAPRNPRRNPAIASFAYVPGKLSDAQSDKDDHSGGLHPNTLRDPGIKCNRSGDSQDRAHENCLILCLKLRSGRDVVSIVQAAVAEARERHAKIIVASCVATLATRMGAISRMAGIMRKIATATTPKARGKFHRALAKRNFRRMSSRIVGAVSDELRHGNPIKFICDHRHERACRNCKKMRSLLPSWARM